MAPPDDETPQGDEGGILSPEELDIAEDENVVEIDEGRYVISPHDSTPSVPDNESSSSDPPESSVADPPGDPELTTSGVHEWLREHVGDADAAYGFDVTAAFEDTVTRRELYSDDVVTTFEGLLVWYAQHAGGNTPVEEALGILLMEANVPIRYPPATIKALIAAHDLAPSDSIADLVHAIETQDAVRFPPED